MQKIKIELDKESEYTINLKEEYNPDEFRDVFTEHLNRISKFCSKEKKKTYDQDNKKVNSQDSFSKSNQLFEKLTSFIRTLGDDISEKDTNTMRAFYSIIKSNRKRRGLAWLQPIGTSLIIYLRKPLNGRKFYENIGDKEELIQYSSEKKRTFGDYPVIKINEDTDLNYIYNIIKNIYKGCN